ncbi:chain length determinant protein tyrosine kinase EpsG [Denitromonas iodatirespirans]|uniref:Chain length determinant protein tyrosine kinase EpsG n=1 Tax=Denitromonas iodatirespirans TaxID=2795389 RepID=A0A944HCI8_DENI1|nr:chain length determinant protein tyrosine kinase EpsG [Denitromonas iodatirespirans]MBT0962767.1 chain length determinant protein tyrosine kinase EpsG [Denitromonas iodatirespirans]
MTTLHRVVDNATDAIADIRPEADRSIGALLIDAGKLKAEDAERVLRLQREQNLRFGDAAKQLGLITDADIEQALLRQFDYPYLTAGQSTVHASVVAAYQPFSPQVEALRALRSQLMLRWFDTSAEQKTLAVTSPGRQEGRSWITANLGVVFSQLGERTLVIDADLRHPRQHLLFGVDNRAGLSAFLSGRGGPDIIQRVPALRDLSVLPAGTVPPNPQELLARPVFAQLLGQLANEFDVILIDTPAGSLFADGQTIAVRASGALVVAQRNASRLSLLRSYTDMLRQASATVVGVVMNER